MSQQDSLCPECGLISWSGHRCAAILEGEEHMNPQPKALVLADALEELDVQFSHTGLCGEAADELRRLHVWEKDYEAVCDERDAIIRDSDKAHALLRWVEKVPLYLAAPQREWVGLTADEIWECNRAKSGSAVEFHICYAHQNVLDFAESIEAKLKEKNKW